MLSLHPDWPIISGFNRSFGLCRPGHKHQTQKQTFNYLGGYSSGLQVINFWVMGWILFPAIAGLLLSLAK